MHEDEDDADMGSCPLRGIDLVILVVSSIADFFGTLGTLLCHHANHKVDQRTMEREARESIERITGGSL
jgi:hypothetical protein